MTNKKRIRILICAFALCAVIFTSYFAIVISDYNKSQKQEDNPSSALKLIDYNEVSDISAISFDFSEKLLSFHRHNGKWLYSDNTALPVSQSDFISLIDGLKYVSVIRTVEEKCTDLSQYGLETPKYTLKFLCQGEEKVYLFGDASDYYSGYYFNIKGSERVYILPSDFVKLFSVELDALLELDTLPDIDEKDNIIFTSVGGITASSVENDSLTRLLQSVEIDRFIDCGSSVYPTYGLDKCASAEIEGKTVLRFSVGESNDIVYMLIGDSQMIYTVKCPELDKLCEFILKSQ